MSEAGLVPLPPGAILLHVGPYKTGSTAIQSALFEQREALAEHGIYYPGKWRRLFREGHSLLRWAPRGLSVPPVSVWDEFAADLRTRADVRVCLSTEDFGRIRNRARSRKIVADLGPDRLHVLAVARAYHRLLPSHWQERVKSTEKLSYEEWLHQVFEGDDTQSAHRSFWSSHDIEQVAAVWLEQLPPDRFTVVVSDDADPLLLSRTFEQLLGLPEGLLAPAGSSNASLSMNAAELLRGVNQAFDDRGWSDRDYRRLVRDGVVPALQRAPRSGHDVPVPPLPEWVRPLVADRSRRRVEAIRALGINVVGDPERLLPPDQEPPHRADLAPGEVSLDAATAAVVGALDAALRQRAAEERARRRRAERRGPRVAPVRGPRVADVGARDLVRELGRRVRGRVRRRG